MVKNVHGITQQSEGERRCSSHRLSFVSPSQTLPMLGSITPL